jgi:hypothetical protein
MGVWKEKISQYLKISESLKVMIQSNVKRFMGQWEVRDEDVLCAQEKWARWDTCKLPLSIEDLSWSSRLEYTGRQNTNVVMNIEKTTIKNWGYLPQSWGADLFLSGNFLTRSEVLRAGYRTAKLILKSGWALMSSRRLLAFWTVGYPEQRKWGLVWNDMILSSICSGSLMARTSSRVAVNCFRRYYTCISWIQETYRLRNDVSQQGPVYNSSSS